MLKQIFLLVVLSGPCFGLEVPKCCTEGKVFDLKKQRCSLPLTYAYNVTSSDEFVVFGSKLPIECPYGLITAQVDSLNDNLLVPGSNKTLLKNEYCIAAHSFEKSATVVYCKPRVIEKCCPVGQVIHSSLRKCTPAVHETQSLVQLKRYDGKSLSFAYNASQDEYYLRYCLHQLSSHPDGIELMGDDSQLLTLTEKLLNKTQNTSYFCIDAVDNQAANYTMTAMVGNPRRQQGYYKIVRKFFPKFCFGSSGFLFFSMIYYCALPKMRKNLHGYAMICFLFSMMVVQLDIGIAFSIASFTCVCAFIPYHRNFFRYSSTAWTTVMGYMIWNQLRSGAARSSQRPNQAKMFGLYSLYAWGLPLLLVLAGVVYDQLYPFTSACWWTSQHVKIFMDVPNIVLQLLNNVFFIPSAMHICKSFRFVIETVHKDANVVVGKRKMAVIKMFFMMQSTKLAEILFNIRSLFDIQSDEYFIGTMCLYSLNGPILFLVLVDIRSLIKNSLAGRFKNGFRSTIIQHSPSIASLFKLSGNHSFDPTPETTESSNANVISIKYNRFSDEVMSSFDQSSGSSD